MMRPSQNRLQLWPFAVLAFIVVLAALSLDVPMRLPANAPSAFRAVPVIAGSKPDPELADEYWQVTVAVMQWKYPFGSTLPRDPPPDFVLPPDTPANQRRDGTARQQYWGALRQLWLRPDVWRRTVKFDVSWAGRAAHDIVNFLSGLVSRS